MQGSYWPWQAATRHQDIQPSKRRSFLILLLAISLRNPEESSVSYSSVPPTRRTLQLVQFSSAPQPGLYHIWDMREETICTASS